MPNKTGQGQRKNRDNQQQSGRDKSKDHRSSTQQRSDNPGNLGNDTERGSGRKGGS